MGRHSYRETELCFYPKEQCSLRAALDQLCAPSQNQLKTYGFRSKDILAAPVCGESYRIALNLAHGFQIKPAQADLIEIIEESEAYLAMHKPPKLHSHPLCYDEEDNALSHLLRARPDFYEIYQRVNPRQFDRGLLFRLDYETSGLLIFIKDPSEYEFLRQNFASQVVRKTYMARVHGRTPPQATLTHYLSSFGPGGKRMRATIDQPARTASMYAQLSFETQKYDEFNNQSLLRVELHTGHRHQIRAQLAAVNHPIVHDPIYGNIPNTHDASLNLQALRYEWKDSQGNLHAVEDSVSNFFS